MTYAQNVEDDILQRFFSGQPGGFFVEVGALDGEHFSNTYLLEQQGWNGICVEPNPDVTARLIEKRARSRCFAVACVADPAQHEATLYLFGMVELSSTTLSHEAVIRTTHKQNAKPWDGYRPVTVPARTLNSILEECEPVSIDLISIDTEWTNAETLRGFDLARWRPRVVVVEIGDGVREQMADYHFIFEHGGNLFYVRDAGDIEQMRKAR
jgi:FkbM family methyltransferase